MWRKKNSYTEQHQEMEVRRWPRWAKYEVPSDLSTERLLASDDCVEGITKRVDAAAEAEDETARRDAVARFVFCLRQHAAGEALLPQAQLRKLYVLIGWLF